MVLSLLRSDRIKSKSKPVTNSHDRTRFELFQVSFHLRKNSFNNPSAVFKVILKDLGKFWRAFHTEWLPESGYTLHEAELRAEDYPAKKNWPSFNRYPDIEVYANDVEYSWESEDSVLYVQAPVVKK